MGLKQGVLEAYKEDYLKINASSGFSNGSIRRVSLIAIRKKYWKKLQVKW